MFPAIIVQKNFHEIDKGTEYLFRYMKNGTNKARKGVFYLPFTADSNIE